MLDAIVEVLSPSLRHVTNAKKRTHGVGKGTNRELLLSDRNGLIHEIVIVIVIVIN
jgi:hypothetical protein